MTTIEYEVDIETPVDEVIAIIRPLGNEFGRRNA
jgi:hypothetical protein